MMAQDERWLDGSARGGDLSTEHKRQKKSNSGRFQSDWCFL